MLPFSCSNTMQYYCHSEQRGKQGCWCGATLWRAGQSGRNGAVDISVRQDELRERSSQHSRLQMSAGGVETAFKQDCTVCLAHPLTSSLGLHKALAVNTLFLSPSTSLPLPLPVFPPPSLLSSFLFLPKQATDWPRMDYMAQVELETQVLRPPCPEVGIGCAPSHVARSLGWFMFYMNWKSHRIQNHQETSLSMSVRDYSDQIN